MPVHLYVNDKNFIDRGYYIKIIPPEGNEVLGQSYEPQSIVKDKEGNYRLWDLVSQIDEDRNIIPGYKDSTNISNFKHYIP